MLLTNVILSGSNITGVESARIFITENNKDGYIHANCLFRDMNINIYDDLWFAELFKNCLFRNCTILAAKNKHAIQGIDTKSGNVIQ